MPRQIKAPPNFDMPVTLISRLMTREWYAWLTDFVAALLNRVPVTGSATFAAATTVAVTFATPEANASYDVWVSPPENKTFWVTSKTINGFTINASSSSSATVRWQLIRT